MDTELKGFQVQSFSTSFSRWKGITSEQADTICDLFFLGLFARVHVYATCRTEKGNGKPRREVNGKVARFNRCLCRRFESSEKRGVSYLSLCFKGR